MAFPSLLSPHFCNLNTCAAAARACLLACWLACRLNEFQFPGFITQPGGGTCGSTKTCQNFSVFLSTGSVRFIVEVFLDITFTFFFRALAFPCLLPGPVSPPAGGQLQPAGGDPLQVQHRAWEAAGHPMEEGRTPLGPAFPWSAASQQRLPGRGRRRGRELPMRCQPAWRRHNPLHCHTSRACR